MDTLSPDIQLMAQGLVKQYFAQCFWFWKPDPQITSPEEVELVIDNLCRFGGKQGWLDAAKLRKCLSHHSSVP